MGAFLVFNLYPGSIFAEKGDRGFDNQPRPGSPRSGDGQEQVFFFDWRGLFVYQMPTWPNIPGC